MRYFGLDPRIVVPSSAALGSILLEMAGQLRTFLDLRTASTLCGRGVIRSSRGGGWIDWIFEGWVRSGNDEPQGGALFRPMRDGGVYGAPPAIEFAEWLAARIGSGEWHKVKT